MNISRIIKYRLHGNETSYQEKMNELIRSWNEFEFEQNDNVFVKQRINIIEQVDELMRVNKYLSIKDAKIYSSYPHSINQIIL